MALSYLEKAIYLIDTQIDFIEKQVLAQLHSEIAPVREIKQIQWQGGRIELVELVYALHEAGSFGQIPLKHLFAFIGKMFGCEISNYYRLFWDIKNRTGEERAFFLNKLQKMLSEKLIRMDSSGGR